MKIDTKKISAKFGEYGAFVALVLLVGAMTIFADGFGSGEKRER